MDFDLASCHPSSAWDPNRIKATARKVVEVLMIIHRKWNTRFRKEMVPVESTIEGMRHGEKNRGTKLTVCF